MSNDQYGHSGPPEPPWTSPGQQGPSQTQQWQGQAGQYYDPSQHYYDPNNPHAWQQGAHLPGGRPPSEPVYKKWWFWSVIAVILVGLVAVIITVLPNTGTRDSASGQPTPDAPTGPVTPDDTGGDPFEESGVQRSEDGEFILDDGGSAEDALSDSQRRIDEGYMPVGPEDLIYLLRNDGFQNDAIEHALNNLSVDWEEQALGVAQEMADNDYGGYSAAEIEEKLTRSGFNTEEIQHAVENLDIDFNEQAVQALESFVDIVDDATDEELRDYLEYAGFEAAEIDYAFDNID